MFPKMLTVVLICFFSLFGCLTSGANREGGTTVSPVNLDKKRPGDKSQWKTITLPNKLQATLISDPRASKSSAALDVRVGTLADPKKHQGLAHFLEHVLFLGTKKYPKVGEYFEFMSKNQGGANAFTTDEHTNYQFQVSHEAFEEGLDRLGQFFISPSFSEDFIARERNAVHSEHQKNLQQDVWRKQNVYRLLHAKDHPRRSFSTGDKNTLKNADRDALISFYKKYYSANVMKLALQSPMSLEEQEKLVKKIFSAVPNRNIKPPQYSYKDKFPKTLLPARVEIKPVKSQRTLELAFQLPTTFPLWKTKPTALISHLVGHEGKGSLLSLLKEKSLATSLGSYSHSNSYSSQFVVQMELTDKGLKKSDEVAEHVFSYLNLLRKFGKDEAQLKRFFKEQKALSAVDYFFDDYEEGSSYVSYIALLMHRFPGVEIPKRVSLIYDYSQKDFLKILSYLVPDNLIVFKIHKDAKTDKVDKFYGTHYSVTKVPSKKAKGWLQAEASSALFMPAPNRFVPTDLSLLDSKKLEVPINLLKDDVGEFWFKPDTVFNLPKGRIALRLIIPEVNSSAKRRLLFSLYARAISESLNEWRYPAIMAGYSFDIADKDYGLSIDFKGYSQKLPTLVDEVIAKLKNITISKESFESIKDNMNKGFQNADLQNAYSQALYEIYYLMSARSQHRKDLQKELSSISLADLKKFVKTDLFTRVGLRGAAYGNLDAKVIKKSLDSIIPSLEAKKYSKNKWNKGDTLKLKDENTIATQKETRNNNNAWVQIDVAGIRDVDQEAKLRLAASFLSQPFFTELRTKKQLGYIVGMNYFETLDVQGLSYIVQSSSHSPAQIFKEGTAWRRSTAESIKKVTDKDFKQYKSALIKSLKEPLKTIDEVAIQILIDGSVRKQHNYKEVLVDRLKKLDKKDFVAFVVEMLKHKTGDNFISFAVKEGGDSKKVKSLKYVKNDGSIRSRYKPWRE